jgi:hypothetical protein
VDVKKVLFFFLVPSLVGFEPLNLESLVNLSANRVSTVSHIHQNAYARLTNIIWAEVPYLKGDIDF